MSKRKLDWRQVERMGAAHEIVTSDLQRIAREQANIIAGLEHEIAASRIKRTLADEISLNQQVEKLVAGFCTQADDHDYPQWRCNKCREMVAAIKNLVEALLAAGGKG